MSSLFWNLINFCLFVDIVQEMDRRNNGMEHWFVHGSQWKFGKIVLLGKINCSRLCSLSITIIRVISIEWDDKSFQRISLWFFVEISCYTSKSTTINIVFDLIATKIVVFRWTVSWSLEIFMLVSNISNTPIQSGWDMHCRLAASIVSKLMFCCIVWDALLNQWL